ncbi:hypothetical protein MPER_08144 [Moniliophthora perniciosa FA553]|nr:hypothetical protein MPER_08144 [Moniliophthora perniciosa FA553]
MGAAIPLLMHLTCALPPILPYAPKDISTEILTGTTEVMDEITPEDEDEEISYQTRAKSTLRVTMKIYGGNQVATDARGELKQGKKRKRQTSAEGDEIVVLQEPEQVEMEML